MAHNEVRTRRHGGGSPSQFSAHMTAHAPALPSPATGSTSTADSPGGRKTTRDGGQTGGTAWLTKLTARLPRRLCATCPASCWVTPRSGRPAARRRDGQVGDLGRERSLGHGKERPSRNRRLQRSGRHRGRRVAVRDRLRTVPAGHQRRRSGPGRRPGDRGTMAASPPMRDRRRQWHSLSVAWLSTACTSVP